MTEEKELQEEKVVFKFENDDEQVLGIETAVYKNGNKIKRLQLQGGRVAIVRELVGRDMKKADLLADGKQEDYTTAMMALATKIDSESIAFEDYDNMKAKDYTKIKAAVGLLNF